VNSKITKAEKHERVSIVYQLLLRGTPRHDILQYVRSQTDWGVSDHAIDYYITNAYRIITEETEKHRESEFAKAVARLNALYNRAYGVGQYQVCLNIQREINELFDLYGYKGADRLANGFDVSFVDEFGTEVDAEFEEVDPPNDET